MAQTSDRAVNAQMIAARSPMVEQSQAGGGEGMTSIAFSHPTPLLAICRPRETVRRYRASICALGLGKDGRCLKQRRQA